MGTNVVLQGNTVAGYERVGFRINGEPCPGNNDKILTLSYLLYCPKCFIYIYIPSVYMVTYYIFTM